MPSIVSQALSTPVVQSVTVTLDADEVFMIVNALNVRGYTLLGAEMRALLDVPVVHTPETFLATGALDGFIRDQRRILAIKALREEFPVLGLKEAKDFVDARRDVL